MSVKAPGARYPSRDIGTQLDVRLVVQDSAVNDYWYGIPIPREGFDEWMKLAEQRAIQALLSRNMHTDQGVSSWE